MLTCTIAPDPCPPGGLEQRSRVGHGPLVVGPIVGEPDPVGVVEGGDPVERPLQTELGSSKSSGRTSMGEWLGGTSRMPGQRPHPAAPGQKGVGDGPTRVAEGAGDHVHPGVGTDALPVLGPGLDRGRRHDAAAGPVGPAGPAKAATRAASCPARSKRARAGDRSPSRWLSISRPR